MQGLVPVVMVDVGLCSVMSGSGLSPPGESSVDPMGIPTRPMVVDCPPRPLGEEAEAVALDDAAAVPLTQVPEALPDKPAEFEQGSWRGGARRHGAGAHRH